MVGGPGEDSLCLSLSLTVKHSAWIVQSRCGFEGGKVALHGVCVIHPHPEEGELKWYFPTSPLFFSLFSLFAYKRKPLGSPF